MWNVFLFVICGGSLIYGFVQQRRIVESRVQMDKCRKQADSLKTEMEKMKEQMEISQKQLQVERDATMRALSANRSDTENKK